MCNENKDKIIQRVRKNWLHSLLSLSDLQYQQERWLDPRIRNPHYTFIEFIESYGDTVYDYKEAIDNGLCTEEEYTVLEEFDRLLSEYDTPHPDFYDHAEILADPKWIHITNIGGEAMKRLRALIVDPEEQKIFDDKLYIKPLREGDFTWGTD